MKQIMVDCNVPLIATGQIGEAWAVVILEEVIKQRIDGYTDTFYLQEILDRFSERGELYNGQKIFQAFWRIVSGVAPVLVEDFDRAAEFHTRYPQASPRDLLHTAVAERVGIPDVFSVDGPDFDLISEARRVSLPVLLRELNLTGTYTYERPPVP